MKVTIANAFRVALLFEKHRWIAVVTFDGVSKMFRLLPSDYHSVSYVPATSLNNSYKNNL